MALQRRRTNEIIPQYSLTGDLLSFLHCGLQYRYHNGSSLPPSRPVQLWFGEFIHGIMEGAYRIWRDADPKPAFPWPMMPTSYRSTPPKSRLFFDIGTIGDTVETTLRAQGKIPRSSTLRNWAYKRAEKAVNELGPDLFPLISSAEERVIGTRNIPTHPGSTGRAHLYELHGIIDVVTDLELMDASDRNVFKREIQAVHPGLTGRFELILDYKGARRPGNLEPFWEQGDWQVQTYAWLRGRQSGSLPVIAGVLIYINELAPTSEDLKALKREIETNQTDIQPKPDSEDKYKLDAWAPGRDVPNFTLQFRLARALRIIPINDSSMKNAINGFDQVVRDIEQCVFSEAAQGKIIGHWNASGDDGTCAACDFRHFCPSPAPRTRPHLIQAPDAP